MGVPSLSDLEAEKRFIGICERYFPDPTDFG
jgi:hypothetical protein